MNESNIPTGSESALDDMYSEWFECDVCGDDNKGTHCKNCELLETD